MHVDVRLAFLINDWPAVHAVQPRGTYSPNTLVVIVIVVMILTIVHVNTIRCLSALLLMCIQYVIHSSTGPNSASQEQDLGQRRGQTMQLAVSTMASSILNC